jgi:hypothetical protein
VAKSRDSKITKQRHINDTSTRQQQGPWHIFLVVVMTLPLKHFLTHQLHYSSHYAGDDDDEEEEEEDEARRRQKRRQLVVVSVEILRRREERIQHRNIHRTYLTRPDLNPSPRIGTPWQHMHARRADRAFITTMGVDVATFEYLLNHGFTAAWNSTPIPRNDVLLNGVPRIDRRSLDAAGALGLILHYLASTMREISLQQILVSSPRQSLATYHFPYKYSFWS